MSGSREGAAATRDGYRPGFAKRADNFAEVCRLADNWRWSPGETSLRVLCAVLTGTPELTERQRRVLMLYVKCLSDKGLEEHDDAFVWPSSTLIAAQAKSGGRKCGESTLRTVRKELETFGYLVRVFNGANRPAWEEAVDLAPTMARLAEMEAVDEAVREEIRGRREAYSRPGEYVRKVGPRGPGIGPLEQSPQNFVSSVRDGSDAPAARNRSKQRAASRPGGGAAGGPSTQRTAAAKGSALRSPGGASGFARANAPSVPAEMLREELQMALQVCPRLAALVPPGIVDAPPGAWRTVIDRITAAADELLPQAERNNALSVGWGWSRHGRRVLVMLAIALEDPAVQDPCKYFGWMATYDGAALDLRLNLRRIILAKGKISPPPDPAASVIDLPETAPAPPPLMAAPGADDPRWVAIATELRRRLREGRYGAWFGRIGFRGIEAGVLSLTTPTETAALKIKSEFVPAILAACEATGEDVQRVSIILRRPGDQP